MARQSALDLSEAEAAKILSGSPHSLIEEGIRGKGLAGGNAVELLASNDLLFRDLFRGPRWK